jgi:LysR family hydrogen peroxide-inducible transcriptional activator
MTLTELSYIVALAQEQHFGRAAERCHVSQPTLSIAVKKLEEELDVTLFERCKTPIVLPLHAAYHVASLQPMLNPWISTP